MSFSEISEELQRVFPSIYSSGDRRNVMNSEADLHSQSPANSLRRIRQGMQNSSVQVALEQPSTPRNQQRYPSGPTSTSHRNIPLVSLRATRANSQPPLPPAALARGRAGSGIGITRFLAPSQPLASPVASPHAAPIHQPQPRSSAANIANSASPRERSPATQDQFTDRYPPYSCSSSSDQRRSQDYQHRYLPYQIPHVQFNRRATYLPSGISARSSSRRQIRSQSSHSQGRWFTKTVVLVDSTDTKVPRGIRRQQLHEMGAVIDLVDFFTGWREGKVREAIERAFGGMIDDSKPDPR